MARSTAPGVFDRSGVTVYKERPDAFIVGSIAAGSPGEEAGVKVEDRIIAINGVAAATLSGRDFGRLMRHGVVVQVVVTIADADEARDVVLTLRELIP